MFDAFCLLGAMNSPLTRNFNISKVLNVANKRNLSVYAHGLHAMDESALSSIRNFANEMVCAYADIKGFDPLENHRDKFEFMKLIMRDKF